MSIDYSQLAIPKGKTVKQVRGRAKRQDTKALKAWRDAAWKAQPGGDDLKQWGFCADCDRLVIRGAGFQHGHVHHIRSRRHRETRVDPANAMILCRACHNAQHGREF